jgi:hypothetical protein
MVHTLLVYTFTALFQKVPPETGPPKGTTARPVALYTTTRDHVSSPTSRRGQHGAHAARDERFPRHWAPAARGRMMLDPQSDLRMRPGLQLRLQLG